MEMTPIPAWLTKYPVHLTIMKISTSEVTTVVFASTPLEGSLIHFQEALKLPRQTVTWMSMCHSTIHLHISILFGKSPSIRTVKVILLATTTAQGVAVNAMTSFAKDKGMPASLVYNTYIFVICWPWLIEYSFTCTILTHKIESRIELKRSVADCLTLLIARSASRPTCQSVNETRKLFALPSRHSVAPITWDGSRMLVHVVHSIIMGTSY